MIFRNKMLLTTLTIFLIGGSLNGQLEDISRTISSNIFLTEEVDGRFVLTGRSDTYSFDDDPEGVAVLLGVSNTELEVFFRFLDTQGNMTEWVQGNVFSIPYSGRGLIYIRSEICQTSTMFEYKVISRVGFPEILSTGIFLPDTEDYPESDVRRKQGITDLPKPLIITRSEWTSRAPACSSDDDRDALAGDSPQPDSRGWTRAALDGPARRPAAATPRNAARVLRRVGERHPARW